MPDALSPPDLGNQYADDRVLRGYLQRVLPAEMLNDVADDLHALGALSGGYLYTLQQNDRLNEPTHTPWSAWGERVDEVRVTHVWREAARIAAEHGVVATAYEQRHGRFSRIHQAALAYLFHPSTDLYACPLAMSDGAARALLASDNRPLISRAVPHLIARDVRDVWTSGQWMTERSGGSDVSSTATEARQDEDGTWRLYGHKWFTSAVTSQMALALARPAGNPEGSRGLALFYVEPFTPEGRPDRLRIERLKDKLGTRKLPTAELTLDGTPAFPVAGLEHGLRHVAPMLNVTRTWNALTATAHMRRGLALARDYARRRHAFGHRLADLPLHAATLADLQARYEAAFHLAFRVAALLGRAETGEADDGHRALLRMLTPLAKLLTARDAVHVSSEVLEAFGGAGYVEDTGLPVLLRDAQVLPIWEGTTNVLALDVLRALDEVGGLRGLQREVRRCRDAIRSERLHSCIEQAQLALNHTERWLAEAGTSSQETLHAGARAAALTLGRAVAMALLAYHAQWALDVQQDARPCAAASRYAALVRPASFPADLAASHALAHDTDLPAS